MSDGLLQEGSADMNHREMIRKRGVERRRYERMRGMKAEHWVRLKVTGIAPFTIDRVEGKYQVEYGPGGKRLRYDGWYDVWVKAFDVRSPDGVTHRFATLKEAKAFAVKQLELRGTK